MHMSKETKMMKQHYVPKEHIRRFEKNGNVNVYLYDENKEINSFVSSAANVCKFTNYYEDDPYKEGSTEKILKRMEDECQHEIDIVQTKSISDANCQILVKYVSMLMNRSILLGMITDRMATSGETFGANGKKAQSFTIEKSKEAFMFADLNKMSCTCITSYGREFITADIPVTQLDLRELPELSLHAKFIGRNIKDPTIYSKKELIDDYTNALTERNKYRVYFCPISSSKCLIVYSREYSNFFKDLAIRIGPDPALSVNKRIVETSLCAVYSCSDKKEEISEILNSLPPITGDKLKFMRELKIIQRNGRN